MSEQIGHWPATQEELDAYLLTDLSKELVRHIDEEMEQHEPRANAYTLLTECRGFVCRQQKKVVGLNAELARLRDENERLAMIEHMADRAINELARFTPTGGEDAESVYDVALRAVEEVKQKDETLVQLPTTADGVPVVPNETEREFLGRRVEELKADAGKGYDISAIMWQAAEEWDEVKPKDPAATLDELARLQAEANATDPQGDPSFAPAAFRAAATNTDFAALAEAVRNMPDVTVVQATRMAEQARNAALEDAAKKVELRRVYAPSDNRNVMLRNLAAAIRAMKEGE